MKQFFRSIFAFLYLLYMDLKGGRKLTNYSRVEKHVGELTVQSLNGYAFEIQCQELQYVHSFSNPFFKSKTYTLYSLYGVFTGDAPKRLEEVLSRKAIIPRPVPNWVAWPIARKYIVEAYLDTVIALLSNESPHVGKDEALK